MPELASSKSHGTKQAVNDAIRGFWETMKLFHRSNFSLIEWQMEINRFFTEVKLKAKKESKGKEDGLSQTIIAGENLYS